MAVKVLIGKKAQSNKKDALNEGIGSTFKVFWNELVGGVNPQELGDNGLVTLGLSGNPRFKAALGAADGSSAMVYDIVRAYAAHAFAGGALQSSREDYIKKTISGLWGLSNKTDSKSVQQYHNWVDYLASQNASRAADSSVAATEAEAVETVEAEAETVSTGPSSTPPTPVSDPTGVVEPVEEPEEEPETGEEEAEVDDEEEAEAEEDSKKETFSEKDCSELFDIEDPAIKKLLDKAKADNTIRGKVAEIGRDISLSTDAVTLSMIGLTVAFPPAVGAAGIVGGVSFTAGRVASAIAVIFDLLNGEPKQALWDSIGMFGGGSFSKSGAAVSAKAAEKTAVKVADKTLAKGIEKTAAKGIEKTAAKAIEKGATDVAGAAGVRAVKNAVAGAAAKAAKMEANLAKKLVGMGMSEELADSLSKAIMIKARDKLQEKLNKMFGGMPNPSDFDSDEEYKKAASSHYKEQKKESDKIFKTCFSGDEGTISKTIKSFLDWIHDWVDEVPRWLGDAVGWVVDTKDAIMGDDEEEAGGEEKESEKERQEKEGAFYESKSWRDKKTLHQEHIENELIKRAIKNGRN